MEQIPTDMKVLMNHIYEFKKGVRQMVLFTFNKNMSNMRLSVWSIREYHISFSLLAMTASIFFSANSSVLMP